MFHVCIPKRYCTYPYQDDIALSAKKGNFLTAVTDVPKYLLIVSNTFSTVLELLLLVDESQFVPKKISSFLSDRDQLGKQDEKQLPFLKAFLNSNWKGSQEQATMLTIEG